MPLKFATNLFFFNAWHPLRIKKLTIGYSKFVMLIANPSEDEKKGHKRSFTLKCKCELITKIESCHAFSASLDEACWQCDINSRYYYQQRKQLDHVSNHVSSNMKKIHSGCPGLWTPLNYFLLMLEFELFEHGMVVKIEVVLRKALDL